MYVRPAGISSKLGGRLVCLASPCLALLLEGSEIGSSEVWKRGRRRLCTFTPRSILPDRLRLITDRFSVGGAVMRWMEVKCYDESVLLIQFIHLIIRSVHSFSILLTHSLTDSHITHHHHHHHHHHPLLIIRLLQN